MSSDFVDGISPEAMESLKLPAQFDEAVNDEAFSLDAFLQQPEQPVITLSAKMEAYREASLSHLSKFEGKQAFDIKSPTLLSSLFDQFFITSRFLGEVIPSFFRRSSLYLPQNANPADYGIISFPDDRRYSNDWTIPASPGNRASRLDGNLSCFSQLDNQNVKGLQSSESGVGILYKPAMTLGVIELQPQVDCSGYFRTLVNLGNPGRGSVWVNAELLLGMWEAIPDGTFNLLRFKRFDVDTSGRRDGSFGAELKPYQKSFNGSDLSELFQVQGGRTYLLGVVSRISIISDLFWNNGQPLPFFSPEQLFVYGTMNCKVPKIKVLIKQVDIS
jgi:hypothetical protein